MTMPTLVLTTGEPAGVGPELTVQLLQRPLPSPLVIAGDPDLLLERAALLSLPLSRKGDALVAPGGEAVLLPVALGVPSIPGISMSPTQLCHRDAGCRHRWLSQRHVLRDGDRTSAKERPD